MTFRNRRATTDQREIDCLQGSPKGERSESNPYGRWCGGRELKPPGYPIRWLTVRCVNIQDLHVTVSIVDPIHQRIITDDRNLQPAAGLIVVDRIRVPERIAPYGFDLARILCPTLLGRRSTNLSTSMEISNL